jgi:hypothetical protein
MKKRGNKKKMTALINVPVKGALVKGALVKGALVKGIVVA